MTNAQVALMAAATYVQNRSTSYLVVEYAEGYLKWLEEQDAKISD